MSNPLQSAPPFSRIAFPLSSLMMRPPSSPKCEHRRIPQLLILGYVHNMSDYSYFQISADWYDDICTKRQSGLHSKCFVSFPWKWSLRTQFPNLTTVYPPPKLSEGGGGSEKRGRTHRGRWRRESAGVVKEDGWMVQGVQLWMRSIYLNTYKSF